MGTPSLSQLPGLGARMAERLERLGVKTPEDLLFHLPARYQDRTQVRPIGDLQPALETGCQGVIWGTEKLGQHRSMYVVQIADGTGFLTLRFFRIWPSLIRDLRSGRGIWVFGAVRAGWQGLEMVHPEFRIGDGEPPSPPRYLTPVYPLTEGVTQGRLRTWIGYALDWLGSSLPEHLPRRLREEHDWPPLGEALERVHRPLPDTDAEALAGFQTSAQQRLAFEELLAQHLAMRRMKASLRRRGAKPLHPQQGLVEALLERLSFSLTGAQWRAWRLIRTDLARSRPMRRLLQGDVGSGKTVVAALAALQVVDAGFQVAFLAPTEILAEQHAATLRGWLSPLGVEVHFLGGSLGGQERRSETKAIAVGQAQVVVGTHALFQEATCFARLGLVIIDEQHRFGVHQRMALQEKGWNPHLLIMTATPIPRTLTMTLLADLEATVIDELPPGRLPVETAGISDVRRPEVEERIRSAVAQGEQAYWVCPLVEESETLQLKAATETHRRLQEAFPELALDLVHGRMRSSEKQAALSKFKAGHTHLLVATPVIEVGIDVPNATLMVIEHAERMGLAQLHQLRGRIGRGGQRSACVLLYHPPLGEKARRRIAAMRETNDGFRLAQIDLELRGPGEVLGTKQTGGMRTRIADLSRDRGLVAAVPKAAAVLLKENPQEAQALIRRWVGERAVYGEVG